MTDPLFEFLNVLRFFLGLFGGRDRFCEVPLLFPSADHVSDRASESLDDAVNPSGLDERADSEGHHGGDYRDRETDADLFEYFLCEVFELLLEFRPQIAESDFVIIAVRGEFPA